MISRIKFAIVGTVWVGMLLAVGCGKGGGEMSITDVQPRSGTARKRVKIEGNNFRTDIGYTVYFGSKKSPAVTIIDEHTLVAEIPDADESGKLDVTISADNGDAFKIASVFDYQANRGPAPAAKDEKKGNLKF